MTDYSREINNKISGLKSSAEFFAQSSLEFRSDIMNHIANEIGKNADKLVITAGSETQLPETRLINELKRTQFQWTSYANACKEGRWKNISITTAENDRIPPKPDLRKTAVGIGPVLVFGAGNFPFAFSTAGGDTASAFAAGCPVFVKAHPGHPKTSTLMAEIVQKAILNFGCNEVLMEHYVSGDNAHGAYLVAHPDISAVAFTGSYKGGMALYEIAKNRTCPIPFFAEMGSQNPVFLLPEKLEHAAEQLAKQLSDSVMLGVGQFCTKPGIIVAIESPFLNRFIKSMSEQIGNSTSSKMLNEEVLKRYKNSSQHTLNQAGVNLLALGTDSKDLNLGKAILASVSFNKFNSNPGLAEEVFGPFALIVICKDKNELEQAAGLINAQLTCAIFAEEFEMNEFVHLFRILSTKCGRIIFNGVPTGVEVCSSMQHGGPFPASTDSRFTSVGEDAIRRFARAVCYQNVPDSLLPEELKNNNPLGLWRLVNDQWSKEKVK